MRKQLNDKTRLAESNRCCVTVTLSTVEHMTRCPCSSAYTPIRRLHGKSIMEDGLQPKLSCVPATGILYSNKRWKVNTYPNKKWDSMFLTRRGNSLCTTSTKSTL